MVADAVRIIDNYIKVRMQPLQFLHRTLCSILSIICGALLYGCPDCRIARPEGALQSTH